MSSSEGSYRAEFKLDTRPRPHRLTEEHCMTKRRQIVDIGRDRNQQVRNNFLRQMGPLVQFIQCLYFTPMQVL
jgi:hypothetical protein